MHGAIVLCRLLSSGRLRRTARRRQPRVGRTSGERQAIVAYVAGYFSPMRPMWRQRKRKPPSGSPGSLSRASGFQPPFDDREPVGFDPVVPDRRDLLNVPACIRECEQHRTGRWGIARMNSDAATGLLCCEEFGHIAPIARIGIVDMIDEQVVIEADQMGRAIA